MPARNASLRRVTAPRPGKGTTRSGASFGRVTKPRTLHSSCKATAKTQQPAEEWPRSPCSLQDAMSVQNALSTSQTPPTHLSASARLSLGFLPSGPPLARQEEFERIYNLVSMALQADAAATAIYVCGTPGTGKSLTVSKVLHHLQVHLLPKELPSSPLCDPILDLTAGIEGNEHFEETSASEQSRNAIWINCAHLRNPRDLYSEIAGTLKLDKPSCATADTIRNFAASPGPRHVVVLDEVDFLVSRDQHVLYAAFEWPHLPSSRLLVVGIANAIDLPVRLLPWLRLNSCMPEIISFTPYDATALASIITQRLKDVEGETVLTQVAISLAAKKVAAGSGDARLVLDVCREAEERVRRSGGDAKQSIAVVSSVLSERGGLSAAVDTVRHLPVQQQLALCCAANAVLLGGSRASGPKKGLNKKATLGGLYDSFIRMCARARVSCVPFPEFADICCNALVHHGLLDVPVVRGGRVKVAKTLRTKAVRLRVPIEDVRAGLADRGFLPMLIAR